MNDVTISVGRWDVGFVALPEEVDDEGRQLLRADVYYRGPGAKDMEEYDPATGRGVPRDSSLCTLAPATTARLELQAAAVELAAEMERWWTPEEPWHRNVLERWSWRTYGGGAARDSGSWVRVPAPRRADGRLSQAA